MTGLDLLTEQQKAWLIGEIRAYASSLEPLVDGIPNTPNWGKAVLRQVRGRAVVSPAGARFGLVLPDPLPDWLLTQNVEELQRFYLFTSLTEDLDFDPVAVYPNRKSIWQRLDEL